MLSRTGLLALTAGLGLALPPALTAAPEAVLVKNINTTAAPGGQWSPGEQRLLPVGNRVFFLTNTPEQGLELSVSDGTVKGTRQVKDITPGPTGSALGQATASGNRMFFSTTDGVHGQELWVSDGTSAGTRMVADMISGPDGGLQLTSMQGFRNGVAFLARSDAAPDMGLWWTDGTENGTRLLRILPTNLTAEMVSLVNWRVVGNDLYLSFAGGENAAPFLWKTDGTAAKTITVPFPAETRNFHILGQLGNHFYLNLSTDATGEELWKLDLKTLQVTQVKDIYPGPLGANPLLFVTIQNKAYFSATSPDLGWTTWETDGTPAGTRMLEGTLAPTGQYFQALGQQLIFRSDTEIYAYNVQTRQRRVIYTVPDAGEILAELIIAGSKLYFTTRTQVYPYQYKLFTGNGTATGSKRIGGAIAAGGGFVMEWPILTAAGSQIFFTGSLNGSNYTLWKSNGSDAGTVPLQSALPADQSSYPQNLTPATGGLLYFSASDGIHGRELWRTDGTAAGTAQVADLAPGASGSDPQEITVFEGLIYFTAETPGLGRELWRTNGTVAGTSLVKDFYTGPHSSSPLHLKTFGGRLYFFTQDTAWKLWKSDGTADGTILLATLYSSGSINPPGPLFEHNGRLYFSANFNVDSAGIYYTDGTPGTVLNTLVPPLNTGAVANFVSAPVPGSPGVLALYFTAYNDNTRQWSIHRLSHAGVLTSVSPGFPEIRSMDRCGDSLIFTARASAPTLTQWQLWQATGAPGGSSALVTGLALLKSAGVVGDSFYYTQVIAPNEASLRRLHVPTQEITTVHEGFDETEDPVVVGDTLFFTGLHDQTQGLWMTRGTRETTEKIPGVIRESYRNAPQRLGNRLFLASHSPGIGQELFSLNLADKLEITHISGEHDETLVPVKTDGTGIVDIGSQYVSYQRGSTLRLRNTGLQPLLNVIVPGAEAPFTLESLTIPRMEPGEEVIVHISFTPQATGPTDVRVDITGTSGLSGEGFILPFFLRGTGLADRGRPIITRMPDHRIVRVGEPLMYQADCHSALPLTKQVWQRSGKVVASTSILNIPSAQIQDAGLYTFSATNAAGTTKSSATILVVVAPIQETLAVPEDGLLTLKATVAAPAGSDVTYQWLRGGTPLSSVDRVRGSRSATLTVSGMSETDTGPYECAVALTTNGQTSRINPAPGVTVVSMLKKPVFAPSQTPGSFLAEEVSHQIIVQDFTSLKVKGLPPGLKMNSGGLVTGRATKAGVYPLTLTATNAAGPREHTLPWTVVPALPAGVYDGLISQDSGRATETQLGSRLMMIATSTGTLSCRFVYEGRILSFAGIPAFKGLREDTTPATVLSEFNLIQGGTQPTLTLRFESGPQGILLLLKNGETLLGSGRIYPTRFYATGTPATGLVGNSTWHSQPEAITEDTPQGHGYAVAATTQDGMVYFQGRLADGTAVLGSSPLLKNPMDPNRIFFCFRHYLYPVGSAYTGSYGGEVDLQPEGENRYRFSGALDWKKAALPATSKERNYKDGIPLHSVFLFGSTYVPPASGKLVWNLTAGTGNGSFATAPAGGTIAQGVLDIGAANKVTLPPVTGEMPLKTLTFDVKQGIFKGTLLFLGETAKLNRTVTFEGALDSLDREGNGAFLLPDLPADGTTLTTSPLRSGAIQIRAEAAE